MNDLICDRCLELKSPCCTEHEGLYEPCEHENLSVETADVSPDSTSSYSYYVCDDCGEDLPLELANPKEDAYDAMVDAQIDEMRGK